MWHRSGRKLPDQPRQRDVIEPVGIQPAAGDRPEIVRQVTEQLFVFRRRHQKILDLAVDGGDGGDQVPDVRADAEVAQSPGVDRNSHVSGAYRGHRPHAGTAS